jgi:hypothetical protein
MGFNVYGKAPRSEAGRYFGQQWDGWHRLARLCLRVAPDICSQFDTEYWFSNAGYGLDDAGAVALADALEKQIDSDALKYEDALSGQESAADREVFHRLKLTDGRLLAFLMPEILPDGKPWLIGRVRKFIVFLRDCGGFEIW